MSYDKVIVSECGEEFPYSESFDADSYYYQVSVLLDGKDGELFISRWGSHIAFEDGSWLDFQIAPEEAFPNQDALTHENILHYMGVLVDRMGEGRMLSKKDVERAYRKYVNSKK